MKDLSQVIPKRLADSLDKSGVLEIYIQDNWLTVISLGREQVPDKKVESLARQLRALGYDFNDIDLQ